MLDLAHWFGNDLSVGATGDLLAVDEPERSEQRIVRRLLTNPGDYIWHLDYGAGLAGYIGKPAAAETISAIVRAQIGREASVAKTPDPQITVTPYATGVMTVSIVYWNNATGTKRELSFDVNR